MVDNLLDIINRLNVPKVILRHIIMKYLDLTTIRNLILVVKEMNVLDDYSKDLLNKAHNGFIWNCKHGNLAVSRWLYIQDRVNISMSSIEYAFMLACKHGHLIIVKWLYDISKSHKSRKRKHQCDSPQINNNNSMKMNTNIHIDNEYAFRFCCGNGHLHIAKWLYSLDKINISAKNENAFRWSCRNGHLVVAQWLCSIGNINIHAKADQVFQWVREYDRLIIEQWLFSMKKTVSC